MTPSVNGLYSPHQTVIQPDLDAMWVTRRFRQNIPNNALGELSRTLILLQYDGYFYAGLDIASLCSGFHFNSHNHFNIVIPS